MSSAGRPRRKRRTISQHFGQDNADWEAVDNLVRLQFAHAQSFPHDLLALIRDRMAAGHGGFPLVGTPEQVADGIARCTPRASAARRCPSSTMPRSSPISATTCCRSSKRAASAWRGSRLLRQLKSYRYS